MNGASAVARGLLVFVGTCVGCAPPAPTKPLDAYSTDGPKRAASDGESAEGAAADAGSKSDPSTEADQQADEMLAKLLPAEPSPPPVKPSWKLTVETSGGKSSEKRRTMIRADGTVEDDVASASRPREIRHGRISPALVARLAAFVDKQRPQAPKRAPAVSNASTVTVEIEGEGGKGKRRLVSKPAVDKDWAPARAIQNAVEIVAATTKLTH